MKKFSNIYQLYRDVIGEGVSPSEIVFKRQLKIQTQYGHEKSNKRAEDGDRTFAG